MTLRAADLNGLMDKIIEIDSYKSKMGSDAEIVTLSFSLQTKEAAEDLENFIEKGYRFVLDADATSGEQSDGTYKVFVEIERNKDASEQIMELVDGVNKLTGYDQIKFRYYKNFRSYPLTQDNLSEQLPIDPDTYGNRVNESNMENYKNFFNKSYVDIVDMFENDTLLIKKIYSEPLYFKVHDFGDTQETLDAINESFNCNEFAEIIFLSKYIGDYNITKYGDKLTFENAGKTLVATRLV
jgi:hypothetical protein